MLCRHFRHKTYHELGISHFRGSTAGQEEIRALEHQEVDEEGEERRDNKQKIKRRMSVRSVRSVVNLNPDWVEENGWSIHINGISTIMANYGIINIWIYINGISILMGI